MSPSPLPSPLPTPEDAATYAQRVRRHVPGLDDMHRMAGLLLAERVPEAGHVLVLGAGGGMELRAFATAQPGWRFDGVDPSAAMIRQAEVVLGDLAGRVTFRHGLIGDVPPTQYDGATCLLTLHFLPAPERVQTLREVFRRLRPGAPFVVAHHSFAPAGPDGDRWLHRNAALLVSAGVDPDQARKGIDTLRRHLPALPPEQDEALFRQAGFTDLQLFYAGFTFRGWVMSRPE